MSSFFANEVAAIGSDPISQDASAVSGQNSEAPSSISSENILERGKRPPEMPLIQHSKEKCRRIAAQLQAKTDQVSDDESVFLCECRYLHVRPFFIAPSVPPTAVPRRKS